MEEKKPEKEKLSANFMVDEFVGQQLAILNKKEEKNDDANANGRTTREKHLEGNSGGAEDPDSKLGKESVDDKGSVEGS